MEMNSYAYHAVVTVAICAVVAVATWLTKDPDCLWGLVILLFI